MHYRPDIDGLRAVAVVAVILYHFGIPGFSGGYVGVDVFFVISGYLITRLIYMEIREQRFSVGNFYNRRIRRILPALTVVVAFTTAAGWFLLLPDDFAELGRSVSAVAAFGSNFLFWKQAGYFAPEAHQIPLLHTWSLAVEEQFYILWPLILAWLIPKTSRVTLATVVCLALACSLVIGEWLLQRGSFAAGFYLSPARAWELMIGAVLALDIVPRIRSRYLGAGLSLAGLALVIFPVLAFDAATSFPGLNALVPCLGTALLIVSGDTGRSFTTRVLSTRAIVFVGLISYSLYLWHWPFVAYFHYFMFRAPGVGEAAFMIAVCFVLAAVTWKYVEQPCRRRGRDRPPRQVIAAGLTATAATLLTGLLLVVANGIPNRLPPAALTALSVDETLHPFSRKCLSYVTATEPEDDCVFGTESGNGSYQAVLWGDSHAAHYMPAIEHVARRGGWSARQMSMAGCAPFLHSRPRSARYVKCPGFNEKVFNAITGDENVRIAMLAARWASYDDGFQEIEDTVARLVDSGRRVLLLGQVPDAPFAPDKCLAMARWFGWAPRTCDIDRRDNSRIAILEKQNQVFRSLAEKYDGVEAFLPFDHLCDDRYCYTSVGDTSLYFDNNHFHPPAARYLAEFITSPF